MEGRDTARSGDRLERRRDLGDRVCHNWLREQTGGIILDGVGPVPNGIEERSDPDVFVGSERVRTS